jgi:hypothetical protein
MLEYTQGGENILSVPDIGRRITVYRGQKTWERGMVITANSLRRSGGSPSDRELWTRALLTQFRSNIDGAMRGDRESSERLESMLLNAQQRNFPNPFVSCSFSTSTAVRYATEYDTPGYILTIEGPWYSGIDFEFVRNLFGLYTGPFGHLQEWIARKAGVSFYISTSRQG